MGKDQHEEIEPSEETGSIRSRSESDSFPISSQGPGDGNPRRYEILNDPDAFSRTTAEDNALLDELKSASFAEKWLFINTHEHLITDPDNLFRQPEAIQSLVSSIWETIEEKRNLGFDFRSSHIQNEELLSYINDVCYGREIPIRERILLELTKLESHKIPTNQEMTFFKKGSSANSPANLIQELSTELNHNGLCSPKMILDKYQAIVSQSNDYPQSFKSEFNALCEDVIRPKEAFEFRGDPRGVS